jgi:hypothetical protein
LGTDGKGAFRFDNNYLDSISGEAIIQVFSESAGGLFGVIDNNTMHNNWRASDINYGPYGIQIWNDWHPADACWGADGWVDAEYPGGIPFNRGDAKFVFIEDNLLENIGSDNTKYMRHYISAELGGRYVVRYNTFSTAVSSPAGNRTMQLDAHGFCLCDSNGKGARGGEVYNNTFLGTAADRTFNFRGGHWYAYDNTWIDAPNNWGVLQEYRAGASSDQSQCSSSCPCTSNWHPQVGASLAYYPLDEQIQDSYFWNNLYMGVNQPPTVDSGGVTPQYIQLGRDYFVSTAKPSALSSYSPYTYPHPLRGTGTGLAPSPPTNLRIQ